MPQPADGYADGWQQYTVEAEYDDKVCDKCGDELADGETYWTRDDEILCEFCFAEWREENS